MARAELDDFEQLFLTPKQAVGAPCLTVCTHCTAIIQRRKR
jgi:hypothetical protein